VKLSVLIAAYESRRTVAATLAALRLQSQPAHEIVVVESSGDGTDELVKREFPEVRLVVSESRLFPGAARQTGLRWVTGDVVACLDADCVPEPEWTASLTEAIGAGAPAVAGAVLNAAGSTTVGWAYFLSEFTPWLPGAPRELRDAPTCNTAYRAGLAEQVGGFPDQGLLSADSLLHWRLRERLGVRLRFVPQARVRHDYRGGAFEMLRRRFEHGRSLSAARRLFRPLGVPARVSWALAAALALPLFYLLRLFATAFGHPDVPRWSFLRALPLTVLALLLWAWGQAAGLLAPLRAGAKG
jgi:glycosyltransferase involved in cell wall biosynthesis